MKTKLILFIICLTGCLQSFSQNKCIIESNDSVKIIISSAMDSTEFSNLVKQVQESFSTTIKTTLLKFSPQKKLQAISGSVFTANKLESTFDTKKLKAIEVILLKHKNGYTISSIEVLDKKK